MTAAGSAEKDPAAIPIDALQANFTLFNDTTRHTATFVLLGLGWFVAKDQGQPLVVGEGLVTWVFEAILLLVLGVQAATLIELWLRNRRIWRKMGTSASETSAINSYRITLSHGISSIAVIVLLFAGLMVVIWVIGGYLPPTPVKTP